MQGNGTVQRELEERPEGVLGWCDGFGLVPMLVAIGAIHVPSAQTRLYS